jgi:hypothetical protein
VLAFALPASAALVTLAALPGAANAAAQPALTFYQTYGTQQGAVRGPGGQIWQIAMMPPEFQGNPGG